MPTVIEIVSDHLRTIGADGLVYPGECGCELGHLAPCNGGPADCQPGWKGAPADPDHGDWSMYPSKDAATGSGEAA